MGMDGSKINVEKMPAYYIEEPAPSPCSIAVLDQSLHNIIHGPSLSSSNSNKRVVKKTAVPFSRFYEIFYARLDELEVSELCEYLDYDLENKSVFLVILLKLVVAAPKHTLLGKKNGKWRRKAAQDLRDFFNKYCGLDVQLFGPIGEALFHSVRQCDEMYTQVPHRYWVEAYSLFLQRLLPLALKRKSRRARTEYDLRFEDSSPSESHSRSTSPESYSSDPVTPVSPVSIHVSRSRSSSKMEGQFPIQELNESPSSTRHQRKRSKSTDSSHEKSHVFLNTILQDQVECEFINPSQSLPEVSSRDLRQHSLQEKCPISPVPKLRSASDPENRESHIYTTMESLIIQEEESISLDGYNYVRKHTI